MPENRHTEISHGAVVIAYLQDPKERMFGILFDLNPCGLTIRGLDLAFFDDWMHQEASREEKQITPLTRFYPMHRIQRVELDENIGMIPGLSRRFAQEVGQELIEALSSELH